MAIVEKTTFLDMSETQISDYITAVYNYQNTNEKKAESLLYIRRVNANDKILINGYSTNNTKTEGIVRTKLSALLAADPSLFSGLFPPLYPSFWYYQGVQSAKYKPSAAGITKIEDLGLTNADANAIEFYLTPDVRKGFTWNGPSALNYTDINQNYPYSVMIALIPDTSQPDMNDKSYLWLADKGPGGSNDWVLAIIKKSELDPTFPILTPVNGITAVNSIHNYTFGSQGTISVPGSNPNFQIRPPNDVTFI